MTDYPRQFYGSGFDILSDGDGPTVTYYPRASSSESNMA